MEISFINVNASYKKVTSSRFSELSNVFCFLKIVQDNPYVKKTYLGVENSVPFHLPTFRTQQALPCLGSFILADLQVCKSSSCPFLYMANSLVSQLNCHLFPYYPNQSSLHSPPPTQPDSPPQCSVSFFQS